MNNCGIFNLYDYFRDFIGPVMYFVQNIILAVTAIYALRSIGEARQNTNRQISNQEEISRKRATLDLILNMGADTKYNDAKTIVSRMRTENLDPAHLRSKARDVSTTPEQRKLCAEQFRACQYVLNRLALFASGIDNGVLDEETFKAYYYSTFMFYVEFLRGYILELRRAISSENLDKNHISPETFYQENISLYNKWKGEPLKKQGSGQV